MRKQKTHRCVTEFAYNKSNVTLRKEFVFERVETIAGNKENAAYNYFQAPLPQTH